MIEEEGVVISVEGDLAEVEGRRRSTCGGCAVNGACGTSLMVRYFGRRRSLLRVRNVIGAGPGDRVVFGLPEGALLEVSFIAYLVPLVAMVGGAVLGEYVAGLWAPAYTQGMSVISGIGALAAAFTWLGRFSRARDEDDRYRPRILRRVGPGVHAIGFPPREFSGKRHTDGV